MASENDTTTVSDLGRVAEQFREIGDHLRKMTHRDPLEAVARMAVELIDRAEWASITRFADGEFETVALTDEKACEADAIQYAVGSGPCLDAIIQDAVYRPNDLRRCESEMRVPKSNERWRRGARASSASIAANSFSMARADGAPSVSLRWIVSANSSRTRS